MTAKRTNQSTAKVPRPVAAQEPTEVGPGTFQCERCGWSLDAKGGIYDLYLDNPDASWNQPQSVAPGRPLKYTVERIEIILDTLRKGLPKSIACQRAGVDMDTCKSWEDRFSDFADVLNRAAFSGLFAAADVLWASAMDKDPAWREQAVKSAQWILSRFPSYRDDFGDRTQVQLISPETDLQGTLELLITKGILQAKIAPLGYVLVRREPLQLEAQVEQGEARSETE